MAEESQPSGILASLRRVVDTLLSSVHNRIELFAVELQEEKFWLIATLVWAAASVFFCGLAIIFVVGTAVYLASEAVRPWLLGGFSVVFVVLAVNSIARFRRSLREKTAPLAETVRELKKDIEWIRSQD
jgi:uncharacterized membrane protein YqjE